MIGLENSSLYEETKMALTRFARSDPVVRPTNPANYTSSSEEATEYIIDILKLESQPEIILCDSGTEFVEVGSSTPLAMFLCEFATALTNEECSPMELQILRTRCTFIASLPDRVANALFNTFGSTKALEIDVDLLLTRICQTLCCFLFAIHELSRPEIIHLPSTVKRYKFRKSCAVLVCEVLIETLIRRGYIRSFFQFFVSSIKVKLTSSFPPSEEIMPLVFKAVYKSSFKKRDKPPLDKMGNIAAMTVGVKTRMYWSEWNAWFLKLAERDGELKPFFISSLVKMIKIPENTDEKSGDDMKSISQALMNEIFVVGTSYLPSERGVLRLIFKDLLSRIVPHSSQEEEESGRETIPRREMDLFTGILKRWSDRDVIEKGSIELNTTLANSVLYVLLHIKKYHHNHNEEKKNHLPVVLLEPLLAGVSSRFEIVRINALRDEGIIVASAFASFFVGDSEACNAFSNMEQFPALLNHWLNGEADPRKISEISPLPHNETHKTGDDNNNNNVNHLFCRRGMDDNDEEYPLNPDMAYTFFSRKRDCEELKTNDGDRGGGGNSGFGKTVIFAQDTIVNHEHLPSFGKTVHEPDELEENVSILVTLRESYNAIMGIGRGSNAQAHEVQHAIESGLRGFSVALKRVRDKLGIWKEKNVNGEILRSREKIGMEINPMISSLLPTLMTLNIHAPESLHNELMKLRYSVMVLLIIIVPENALTHLGKMLYSSHYGIFQRVEMAKAIGEAAKYLSQVEVRLEPEETSQQVNDHHKSKKDNNNNNNNNNNTKKRIYPPIRTENTMPMSIVITEGKETRRWGNAVAKRAEKKARLYSSYLANVASFFVSALLEKAENDHFAFFSDHDPYAPAEILRSICTVVQCIASARHIAPGLCENLIPFAILVITKHPLLIVRKQGWVLVGEIMRCWCGAGPLVQEDGSLFLSRGVFGGSLSYVFSQEWLTVQQGLEAIFEKRKDDLSCVEMGLLVLADLQDLVRAKRDIKAMEYSVVNRKIISMTPDTKKDVKIF